MTEHTKGPWIFDPDNVGQTMHAGYALYDRDFESGRELCYVLCSVATEDALGKGVPEANARLIAASPTMLQALEAIEKLFADTFYIRKIEGSITNADQERIDKTFQQVADALHAARGVS